MTEVVTTKEIIGDTCALAAALTWAFALVLFKRSGERVAPLALNLFKNTVGLILLGATILLMPAVFACIRAALPEDAAVSLLGSESSTVYGGLRVVSQCPREDIVILVISGVLGIALADTVFFYSLNLIGVGLISIVDCLYSPLIILFSCLILSERPGPAAYLGTALILTGVLTSSRHAPPFGRTRGQVILGILGCALAMALMTFGIVITKPVLEFHDFPLIEATALRMVAGTGVLVVFAVFSSQRKDYWSGFRLTSTWRLSIPASVLGSYFSVVLWMGGFKYAEASIAGILNQTSVIFAIILATLLLDERFTSRKLVAVILATGGVVLVTWGGS